MVQLQSDSRKPRTHQLWPYSDRWRSNSFLFTSCGSFSIVPWPFFSVSISFFAVPISSAALADSRTQKHNGTDKNH